MKKNVCFLLVLFFTTAAFAVDTPLPIEYGNVLLTNYQDYNDNQTVRVVLNVCTAENPDVAPGWGIGRIHPINKDGWDEASGKYDFICLASSPEGAENVYNFTIAQFKDYAKVNGEYWEDEYGQNGISFILYNGASLVSVTVIGEDPKPGKVIYASDFTTGYDGWTLNKNNDGVAGTLNRENNALTADITNSGTEGWHCQLAKTGISLKQGVEYRWTFSVSSSTECTFEYYLDETDTWQSLFTPEHLTAGTIKQEFSSTFTLASTDENSARIAFNLGGIAPTAFTLYSFKLEIVGEETAIPAAVSYPGKIYSSGGNIVINGSNGETIAVYSMDGRLINKTVGYAITAIPSEKGLYIVKAGNAKAQKITVR